MKSQFDTRGECKNINWKSTFALLSLFFVFSSALLPKYFLLWKLVFCSTFSNLFIVVRGDLTFPFQQLYLFSSQLFVL